MPASSLVLPTADDVARAAERIAPFARRTPVIEAELGGRQMLLKLEHLQRSGSFKLRGALNALLRSPSRVVVTASGGNHGLGMATAAACTGSRAIVFLPATAPQDKARRIADLGADVRPVDGDYADAEAAALDLAARDGLPFVPAFAHPDVVAGQGTLALEVLADAPECDAIVVSVGGGGLVAGVATAAQRRVPVLGVEPVGIPTLTRALAAGRPVDVSVESVTASALGARRTGELNLAVAQREAVQTELITDGDVLRARDLLWEEYRLAVEPGAAAALAGLLWGSRLHDAARPCVVLCGANAGWTAQP